MVLLGFGPHPPSVFLLRFDLGHPNVQYTGQRCESFLVLGPAGGRDLPFHLILISVPPVIRTIKSPFLNCSHYFRVVPTVEQVRLQAAREIGLLGRDAQRRQGRG